MGGLGEIHSSTAHTVAFGFITPIANVVALPRKGTSRKPRILGWIACRNRIGRVGWSR